MTNQPPKRRKSLGPPLNRTDADLEHMSEIAPQDIEQAQAFVRSASPGLAKLMGAKEQDNADQDQSA